MGIFMHDRHAFRRRSLAGGVALALTALTLAALAPADPALAQGAVKSVHKDWQIRCDALPGAKSEQCALMQQVIDEKRHDMSLTLFVLKSTEKETMPILRVLAPSGVLLPAGVGLKIDGATIGRTPFVRCLPNGCLAEAQLSRELISQLKKGRIATFFINMEPETVIGFPISLDGFGEGYDKLN